MKILVVEDDPRQSDFIIRSLEDLFDDLEINTIQTESDFLRSVPELEKTPPDLIIIDVMLRWAKPTPHLQLLPQMPDDTKEEGFYRAGFRCLKLIQSKNSLAKVPVIIYSILHRDEVAKYLSEKSSHIVYLQKDFDSRKLGIQIRSLIIAGSNLPPEKKRGLLKRATDAVEAKPGSMGFSFDLKKFFKKSKK